MTETRTASNPGLCLLAPAAAGAEWRARIETALEATKAVTLILTAPPEASSIDPAVARPLVDLAQRNGVAALIADDVVAARTTAADGVHLSWRPEIEDAYEAARNALGPEAVVGAEAGTSRHDAMTLGEAGADYVAFGKMSDGLAPEAARETQRGLIAWWADVFVVPVVAFDAESTDDARDLVRHGADFIAVRLPDAGDDAAWASAFVAALAAPVDAA